MQYCRFGKKYISDDAAIVADPEFENGVVKIQSNNHQDLADNGIKGLLTSEGYEQFEY